MISVRLTDLVLQYMQEDIRWAITMNKKYLQKIKLTQTESGAASIFIVIFFALLLSVITVSFVNIVNQDQQQALNNDLSQSAFDAALAGAEDGKQALDWYRSNCIGPSPLNPTHSLCSTISENDPECSDIAKFRSILGLRMKEDASNEVQVGARDNDKDLNQSYTCASIEYNTDDYERKLNAGRSHLIELKGATPINKLEIEWFNKEDASDAATITKPPHSDGTAAPLPQDSQQWGVATPALLRLQIISVNSAFNLNDIATRTVFLYPGGSTPLDTSFSVLPTNPSKPAKTECADNLETQEYACSAALGLGAYAGDRRFLMVTPLYNQATFNIKLLNNDTAVDFAGVQPIVDVTGRANDVFRRIESRVEFAPPDIPLAEGFDYPAFDSTDSICKAFGVGSQTAHFSNGSCTLP